MIKADGSLDTDSDVFAEGDTFELTVKSAGYANDLSFTYSTKAEEIKEKYTLTFDTDGGSAVAPITQEEGAKVSEPAAPAKEGYTFVGWEPKLPETMPKENLTVKALWEKVQTAEPDPVVVPKPTGSVGSSAPSGGSLTVKNISIVKNTTVTNGSQNNTAPTGAPAPTPAPAPSGGASSDNPDTGSDDPFSAFMFIAAVGLAAADLMNRKRGRKDGEN